MLGQLVNIEIKRNTDEIVNKEYVQEIIGNISGNVIEIKNSPFSTNASQSEEVQQYAFMIGSENTLIKIGDLFFHNDGLGEIISKVIERPKNIFPGEIDSFIKIRTKFIGN